ncbi:helix-turn-helix transcriptional regulator [Streptomyces sp. ODS05-4]|uniref:helix-turn-helix domain-containing protein n=1 Tax=Streptomyces sp. ODS05-4 TaxID=2944939 RepID=UPI00210C1933|nr:helix-turn-helix transcriptional regulator [Streptomyces sp. ODS05-4]
MAKGVGPGHRATWEFWGEELRERRMKAGLTQDDLGRRVFVSGGYIGQFEQAIRKPQLDVAARIDETLQTDGFFERMCRKLINKSPYADYFRAVADLEALATRICEFSPTVVPGLLQTADYARAVTVAANPFVADEYVEDKVSARIDRSRLLADATRPEYWVVLHENVLRVQVGGPAVMAAQLGHIAARVRARELMVAVIPCPSGAHASMDGSLRLMEFEDAPPVGYTETAFTGTLLDDPAVVKKVQRAYDLLRVAALSPEASLALIESAAEEFTRCARTT